MTVVCAALAAALLATAAALTASLERARMWAYVSLGLSLAADIALGFLIGR